MADWQSTDEIGDDAADPNSYLMLRVLEVFSILLALPAMWLSITREPGADKASGSVLLFLIPFYAMLVMLCVFLRISLPFRTWRDNAELLGTFALVVLTVWVCIRL